MCAESGEEAAALVRSLQRQPAGTSRQVRSGSVLGTKGIKDMALSLEEL